MYILMNENKNLIITDGGRAIYKYETGVDKISFLIPINYEKVEIKELNCVVLCLLPDGKTGLYKYCPYDEELYSDNFLLTSVPITTAITKETGVISIWVMFLKPDVNDSKYAANVLKTNSVEFEVIDNGSIDSYSETAFDEVWTHTGLDEIEGKVDTLSENKADGIIIEGNVIKLVSGDNVLNSADVPDNVTWKEWN